MIALQSCHILPHLVDTEKEKEKQPLELGAVFGEGISFLWGIAPKNYPHIGGLQVHYNPGYLQNLFIKFTNITNMIFCICAY